MKHDPKKSRNRKSHYQAIIAAILDRSEFTLQEVQSACTSYSPQLIRRLVGLMAKDGHLLVREEKKETFCSWQRERSSFDCEQWIDQQLFGLQVTQTPMHERPRERLMAHGAEHLRTADLLAILIRSGRPGESAVQAGEKIANRVGSSLDLLRELSLQELKAISPAVSQAVFCQIAAGIELGRRVASAVAQKSNRTLRIDSTATAKAYCSQHFARLAADRRQEEFHIVTLDTKLQPIAHHQITVGTLDASLVAPREVFRPAIRDAAAAVLLVHNHPSGDPTPSRQDFDVTQKLDAAAKLIGIQVVDHIVVGSQGSVSIRDLM